MDYSLCGFGLQCTLFARLVYMLLTFLPESTHLACLTSQNPSQHFAVFNCSGEFATASSRRNKLSLWPQPQESGELMINKMAEFHGGSDMELISGYILTHV